MGLRECKAVRRVQGCVGGGAGPALSARVIDRLNSVHCSFVAVGVEINVHSEG